MAAGEAGLLRRRDRERIGAAVQAAERRCGFQVVVALGSTGGEARATAERVFEEAGLVDGPGALLLVAVDDRRIEIITSPAVRGRVPDAACAEVVAWMVPRCAAGDLTGAVVGAVERLAAIAGPPPPGRERGPELPDVVG